MRETNQDRVCEEATSLFGEPAIVLAVADGMGGMRAGDKAAEIAIETVRRYAKEIFPVLPHSREALRSSMGEMYQEANRRIWEYGQAQNSEGMGTTLVCCVAFDGRFLAANAGDSRCYYINNFEARQLTEDHSRVQELVSMGAMTEDAARRSPFRSQLTNSLGEPHEIRVDLIPPGTNYGVIDEDCVLLLCSDGLHGEVSEEDLRRQAHGTDDLKTACDNLIALAVQRGSTDNVTVAAVECGTLARKGPRQEKLPPVERIIEERKCSEAVRANPAVRSRAPIVLVFGLVLALLAAAGLVMCQDAQRFWDQHFAGKAVPGSNRDNRR